MRIRYRFHNVVSHTVRRFCEVALAGEALPEYIEYGIASEFMCDALRDNVSCMFECGRGTVSLTFGIVRWCGLGTTEDHAGARATVVDLEAEMTCKSDEDDEVTLRWDAKRATWEVPTYSN